MADTVNSDQFQDTEQTKSSKELLMQGPLVAWVRTFREDDSALDYTDLMNGAFLEEVLSRIELKTNGRAIQPAEDVCTRIRHFDNLVRCIKSFYEDVLGQLILTRLPDPVMLGRDPESDLSLDGMQKLLLLVLGCAVQGPSKETIIEDIKKLPLSTQHAIVECIQQVADNPACVWSKDWCELNSIAEDQQESLFRILVQHVRRLVGERDEYAHQVTTLVQKGLSRSGQSPHQDNNVNDRHHSMVELAEAKARIRKWRQEVEEKCEQVAELREELDAVQIQLSKAKQENMDLVQEARLSKALRDELDIVRERALKVDRLEAELNRYKDKLNDIDYYKARLEELREDNRLLEETKSILEGQLENARQRAEMVLELEGELLNYKTQLNNVLAEKDADKERIKKLIDETAHWQLCTKNCLSESASLVAELDSMRTHRNDPNKDIGEQITTIDLQSKSRRLELENQRLVALLSNMKESHFRDSAEKILHLEGENTRLKLKVENLERDQLGIELKLSEATNTSTSRVSEVERQKEDLQRTYQELKIAFESLKVDRSKMEEHEFQLVSLNAENQKLQRGADLLQKRMDAMQVESRDLETENGKLQKTVDGLRNSLRRLNELEKENTELETDNHRLDRENKGLHKEISRLKQAIEVKDGSLDEYSSKISTLEREHKKALKECEAMHNQSAKIRELERENKELQQSTSVERKTLSAIREEFVQEKIKCQQLQCRLDTSTRTLEHAREECITLRVKNEELMTKSSVLTETIVEPTLPTIELGREVLAIKDRLVELERENAVLLAENANLKSHILVHKEDLINGQSQLAAISQQLATLQVENSTISSQLKTVSIQNSNLQTSLTQVEGERDSLNQQLQSTQSRLEQLSRDQEELQKLHEQLQSEYDILLNEKETLKCSQRELKFELRSVNEKLELAAKTKEEIQLSQQVIQEEVDKLRVEARSLNNLRAEHSRLKDDFRSLFVANEKLKSEYKNLQTDYKSMRGEHNALKLKQTQLQGEMDECRNQLTNMDVDVGKLNNKCEVLQQWNNTLEEDKRNLVNQVSILLTQYHELLSQTLEEKDHFHEETKNFSDKLNHLKRQKEILEDKIMEQYRRMENSTPLKKISKSSIGALFVRKMRRASSELISRVPRSRSRSRGPIGSDRDSPDQHDQLIDTLSLESGSHSGSNSGCGSLDGGSGGEGGDVTPTSGVTIRSERDRIRQSMPIINYNHQEPVMRNSFSSDGLNHSSLNKSDGESTSTSPVSPIHSNGNLLSPTNNGNSLLLNLNGNMPQSCFNGNLANLTINSAPESLALNSCHSTTMNPLSSLNGSNMNQLNSSYSSLSSTYSLTSTPIKQVKLNGITRPLNGSTTSLNLGSPLPLNRFNQPSRSLALLDRAGSRQPLCISGVDPVVLEQDGEEPEIVPTRDFGPQSSNGINKIPTVELSHSTPRNISPANSDTSDSCRTSKSVPRPIVQTTGTNPSLINSNAPASKIISNVTSTTRINVNITTPNSPGLSNFERHGSLRLPPRPAPRAPLSTTSLDSSDVCPPIPARAAVQERPALPPRQSSVTEEKPAETDNGNSSTNVGASSIWYEYGCV